MAKCIVCGKVFEEDDDVSAIDYGNVIEDEFVTYEHELRFLCDNCLVPVDEFIEKIKKERQDSRDGGEQRALDRMERGIELSERGSNPFAGHPDALYD